LLFLSAVIAFTVGLKVGRGPLGRPRREASKLMLSADAKSPATPPDQASVPTPQTPAPPVASSNDSAGAHKPDEATPSKEKSKENTSGSENLAQVGSIDADSSPATESKPSAKPEVSSEHSGAIGLIERPESPPASSELAHSPKVVGPISNAPRSPAPHRLTPTIITAPHLPGSSAMLATLPGGESQPSRVSFPEKAVAATSSFAMTSQLSVLVSPEPGPTVAHQPARLEAGKLV